MLPSVTILEGDVLHRLADLTDESVQCCVTSPPYWGLRDYGLPASVWGGSKDCDHDFEMESISTEVGKGNWSQGTNGRGETQPGGVDAAREPIRSESSRGFCSKCGAWKGCLGLEPTPELFVLNMASVFEEVRRVLKPDGTAWVNMGDSYAAGSKNRSEQQATARSNLTGGYGNQLATLKQQNKIVGGLKPKDLCGMPWRLAFALQAAGWYLRCDIIWHKPNPMPESVNDRPTKAHEYIFLLSKSSRYYYDIEAIREEASWNTHARRSRATMGHKSNPDSKKNGIRPYKVPDGWDTTKGEGGHGTIHREGRAKGPASYNGSDFRKGKKAQVHENVGQADRKDHRKLATQGPGNRVKNNDSFEEAMSGMVDTRNKRSVWSIPSQPFKEAHFATFPPDLIKPCILAGSKGGDMVLDPFGGSGTTGMVAIELGRNATLIELNPEYAAMARRRCLVTPGLNLEAK
jgi:DNA modification methylase